MKRRLAAILVADVVGYSRMMQEDEAATLGAIRAWRQEVLQPHLQQHHGRLVKLMGDGVLAEFASAVAALECAIAIQGTTAGMPGQSKEWGTLALRIGLNLGELVEEDGDIYGDGVNLAARLQSVAATGGIALSEKFYRELSGKTGVRFSDLGLHSLKNIAEPVRVFAVDLGAGESKAQANSPELQSIAPQPTALKLPDKPSIAVMPFQNLSGDIAQNHFAEGMTEDIINALSRIGYLFVISKSSSYYYLGRGMKPAEVARELGVRYILEGSVSLAPGRVRVRANLIDSQTSGNVWSERYDAENLNLFDVQDEITRNIALAMQVKLTVGESARLWEGQTRDLRAWEKSVLARSAFLRFTAIDNREAQNLLHDALTIDPCYDGAVALLGLTYWWEARYGPSEEREASLRLAEEQVKRLFERNSNMPAGFVLQGGIALLRHQHDAAVGACQKAVALAPSDSHNWGWLGLVYRFAGESEKAVDAMKTAMRLSPHYPHWQIYHAAVANMWAGNLDVARDLAEAYLKLEPGDPYAYTSLADVLFFRGDEAGAMACVKRLCELFPGFSAKQFSSAEPYRNSAMLERALSVLRKGGLPE